MKLSLQAGTHEVWLILPTVAFLYDPEVKKIELGAYFLKYFLTININR